jgi:hypothetical protein
MKKWASKAKGLKGRRNGRKKNVGLAIVNNNNHYPGFGLETHSSLWLLSILNTNFPGFQTSRCCSSSLSTDRFT